MSPAKRTEKRKWLKGEQLCDDCANVEGCFFKEHIKTLIRTCEEYDSTGDIIGPIPSLDEFNTPDSYF